jgi:prepilin-type processing-associated H-X9-DG protein
VPFRCFSDHVSSDGVDRFQGSYTGSLGSQSTPSASGHCNVWQQFMEPLANNATHGDANTKNELSGMFARGLWGRAIPLTFSDVLDGSSNTFHVGEVLANCQSHRQWGFYHYDGINNAHASTVVPINNMTTCDRVSAARVTHPDCTGKAEWNFAWGFKSYHPGVAQFLFVDGSVHAIGDTINHQTYQWLGGRSDGNSVGNY